MGLKLRFILAAIAFFIVIYSAKANVIINEIMYNPSTAQGSDTDLEWIEIFNNGTATIDLAEWKIDGNNFDGINISAGEYLIVAGELIDGSDSDLDSFEEYYGNNDGVWNSLDGNYNALGGSFSLANSVDAINLSNGSYSIFNRQNTL